MTTMRSDSTARSSATRPGIQSAVTPLSLPAWVDEQLALAGGEHRSITIRTIHGVVVRIDDAGGLALCSTRIENAAALPTEDLRDRVSGAYSAVFGADRDLAAAKRVRMWSFIPDIHAPRDQGLTTYHVFNQGRFDAFVAALGSEQAFGSGVPTASGVGHDGPHLDVHCLYAASPGTHIENPRQVPAYRYSARYGPRPPCFARGTLLQSSRGRLLLIGGTASVRHEVSMFPDDLPAQLTETFENLAALVAAANAASKPPAEPQQPPVYTDLRVYHARDVSPDSLAGAVRDRVGRAVRIELVPAVLCREELLVEIEGVVELGGIGRGV